MPITRLIEKLAAQGNTQPQPPGQGTLVDQLVDPVTSVGKPIATGLVSGVLGIKKTGESLHKAYKDWNGDQKIYDYDDQTGLVNEKKRGVDTETTNGFKKDLARISLESGARAGIKTVGGLGKSAAKSMGGFGEVMSVGSDVVNAINPLKSASQLVTGGEKLIGGGADAIRYQKRKNAARKGEGLAKERNSPLAMGLGNTKRSLSSSRNESVADAGIGMLEAATGGLGIARFMDPTLMTTAAHVGMTAITKTAKKIDLVRSSIKNGIKSEKVMEMRQKADQGDPAAMKWLLENDPRMGSAQLLMHSQEGSEEDKAFAQEHVGNSLSLSKDARQELGTGRLSEFDKLYSKQTGTDIESKLDLKEAGVYKFFRPMVKKMQSAGKFMKGLFKGKKEDAPTLPNLSSNDIADQYSALTKSLDKEQAFKKQNVGGELTTKQLDDAWSGSSLDPQFMPDRGKEEVREYNKVKNFRVRKTYEELVDDAEQGSLKDRFNGTGDGKLFNMNDYTDSTEAIDKTIELVNKPEGLKDKLSAYGDKGSDKVAKMIGPWATQSTMPEDIRRDIIAHEEKRRLINGTAGKNLPSTAPLDQPAVLTESEKKAQAKNPPVIDPNNPTDWVQKQTLHNTKQEELRTEQTKNGTTVGQLAKTRRKEEKANAKLEKEKEKVRLKEAAKEQERLKKEEKKQQALLKKQNAPKKSFFSRN
jgi:hypothetical protein